MVPPGPAAIGLVLHRRRKPRRPLQPLTQALRVDMRAALVDTALEAVTTAKALIFIFSSLTAWGAVLLPGRLFKPDLILHNIRYRQTFNSRRVLLPATRSAWKTKRKNGGDAFSAPRVSAP